MYLTKRIVTYKLDLDRHLLINTLSGALDIVDEKVHRTLKNLWTGNSDAHLQLEHPVKDRLCERFYLFDTAEDEAKCVEDLYAGMKERRECQPVQFAICPTYACNLRCVYCFEGDLTAKPMQIMTPEQVDQAFRAIDAIKEEFHPSANAHIILFGGEPLLRHAYGCVSKILERVSERGYGAEVVTNGVQAEHFADLFAAHKGVINQIQITLDGPPGIHDKRRMHRGGTGTFDEVTANIQRLLDDQLPVTVRINVDAKNIDSLPELMELMEERGWNLYPNFSCYMFPVTAHADAEKTNTLGEDKLLYELQHMFRGEGSALPSFALYGFKVLGHVASVLAPDSISLKMPPLFTYCEANGLRYFAFGPDGNVYPCGQAIGQPDLAIGRFYPELELQDQKCKDWATRSVLAIPQCRECPIATLCGGGCAYGAYKQTGSVMMPNCQNCSATLNAYVEHMRENILKRYAGAVESEEEGNHESNTCGSARTGKCQSGVA